MPVKDSFSPPRALRNGHLQSLLASTKIRWPWIRRRATHLLADERYILLDCGDGVRLSGFYSARSHEGPLVVLIHGWEGGAYSQYMISTGAHLYASGYRVMRMQMRDHGDSHHLNHDLFHSCRLDEAVSAIKEIDRRFRYGHPLLLGGFSLGGNFSLRIGVRAPAEGVEINAIAAVCPVANPARTLRAMESAAPPYERYFMRKWRRSLRRKRKLFPSAYDDDSIFEIDNMRELTERLIGEFGDFPNLDDYFDGYRITDQRLAALSVPAMILAAEDDPIIPPDDFDRVAKPPCLHVVRTRHGGHCGYIDSIVSPTFADQAVHQWFDHHLPAQA